MPMTPASNAAMEAIFESANGFHATNMMGDGNWTLSASIVVPDGDDYVVSVENPDYNDGLVALKEQMDSHNNA